MDRDRDAVAYIADTVDVSGRGEAAHVAGPVRALACFNQTVVGLVEREKLFILNALDDSEDAPGHVVVNRCHLPGAPHERDDGEGAVSLRMEHMTSEPRFVSQSLLGREEIR